jgi:LuxR family maltose regulon positive regulatory protein
VAIFDAKLSPPPPRPGIVERSALVDRLLAHDGEPLLAVAAPPGYGKSTVLAQWSARQSRKVAWVSLDDADNDPAVLLFETAMALNRLDVLDDDVVRSLRSRSPSTSAALARLVGVGRGADDVAVVLDHLEAVDNPEALDVVAELALRLPRGSRMAVATRAKLPLPTPLLRSRGELVEVGIDDLAMNRDEAALLFDGVGVRFGDDAIDRLVEKTEGWPAGLYLAAIAAKLGRASDDLSFSGSDRIVADYFRTEVLARLEPSTVEFLIRTAILDQLSGALCDAVLERSGSHQVLEQLEGSNLLLVAVDRQGEWYRYHRLFRELLLTEARRQDPELVAALHARATNWLESKRMVEAAIGHAQLAGDHEAVARLVSTATQPTYAAGRATTVRRWLEWFHTEGCIDRFPQVAVLGAIVESLQGVPASAERWSLELEQSQFDPDQFEGTDFAGWRSYLRALGCRKGPAQMRADAQAARAELTPGGPLRGAAILLEGLSYLLEGDADAADPILAQAAQFGEHLGGFAAVGVALAARGVIAMSHDDWDSARLLTRDGLRIVEEHRLHAYVEAVLVFAAAAHVSIHDHDLDTARELAGRAVRVRPLLTYAVPCTALFLIELAKVQLKLADPAGARTTLRDARDILRQRPDLGIIPDEVERLTSEADAARYGAIGASSLTTAELRLLPYLSTHLTFPQIGERLHVSRHTVKTHAVGIYRKLDASSRSQAIQRAVELGLL